MILLISKQLQLLPLPLLLNLTSWKCSAQHHLTRHVHLYHPNQLQGTITYLACYLPLRLNLRTRTKLKRHFMAGQASP